MRVPGSIARETLENTANGPGWLPAAAAADLRRLHRPAVPIETGGRH
jgi:hypothetical protein